MPTRDEWRQRLGLPDASDADIDAYQEAARQLVRQFFREYFRDHPHER
jgi:hypothetical protein